jgi:alkanesulfonate monooxygenase SsuD/methylene tetrahydromethanopterin reductase-like flavin-dependent oxidoreductase (luciferase family)
LKFIICGIPNMYENWPLLEKATVRADELGFWGAVIPDSYMWGPQKGGDSTMEAWSIISHLSARTKNIKLGTFVTPIPFRPPGMLAKVVSTVDVVSNGRTVLGVGAGSSQAAFEGYSSWDDPAVRVAKTKEGLELMLRLWEGEKVSFEGKYYSAKGAVLRPQPVQKPHPPLLFGGQKRRMLELAGQYADLCFVPQWAGIPPEATKSIVTASAAKYSREGEISFVGGGTLPPKGDIVEEYKSQVESAREDGYDYLLVAFSLQDYMPRMEEFAREFLPERAKD